MAERRKIIQYLPCVAAITIRCGCRTLRDKNVKGKKIQQKAGL
jgi:hypothetical protein